MMIKLSYLYLTRNVSNTLLKAVIKTALFTVLLLSIVIMNTSTVLCDDIERNVDIYISLNGKVNQIEYFNTDKYCDDEVFDFIDVDIPSDYYEYSDFTVYPLFYSNAGVKDDEYTCYFSVSNEADRKQIYEDYLRMEEVVASSDRMYYLNSLTVKAVNNNEFLDYKLKNVHLTEGRIFSQEEIARGDKVCIISDGVAAVSRENGEVTIKELTVGDTFSLYYEKQNNGTVECSNDVFTVIGVVDFDQTAHVEMSFTDNTPVFIPYNSFINSFHEYQSSKTDNHSVIFSDPKIYKVSSVKDLERFFSFLENNISDRYEGYATLDHQLNLLATIKSVRKNFQTISSGMLILFMMLSMIMSVLDVYFRRKEAGILSSLGLKQSRIVLQFSTEYTIINTISLLVASILGYILAKLLLINYFQISDIDIGKYYINRTNVIMIVICSLIIHSLEYVYILVSLKMKGIRELLT